MKKWEVALERIDVTYVTVTVEADSPEDASLKAMNIADDEADQCGEVDLGHWEPAHIEETKES